MSTVEGPFIGSGWKHFHLGAWLFDHLFLSFPGMGVRRGGAGEGHGTKLKLKIVKQSKREGSNYVSKGMLKLII